MQIFEKNKKLKINFTAKDVYDKADVELYPNDNGEAVLEVNGQAGGGLPEGGNKGDVLTLISAGSAAEGKLITDGVTPIHKLFLNKEALLEYLPQLNYDPNRFDVCLTDIDDDESSTGMD